VRVQFYNPPVHHYSGIHYRMNPPLGLPIMAAVLQQAGHVASVWDLEALSISPTKLGKIYAAQENQPDAVGFTCTTHNQRGVRECIKAIRDAGYTGYVMVGGPHITMLADGAIDEQSAWGADVWVAGECEGNIAQIIEEQPRGLVKGQAAAIETIPAPLWERHHPGPTQYGGNMPRIDFPESIAMWSRGCPHNCIFCGNPVFGHQRIRMRPPARVYEDMAKLKDMGVKTVFVYDDELIGMGAKQNEWLIEVCKLIEPLGMTWKCQGRCSQKAINPEVLQAMHAAGCRAIMWGVESFNDEVLRSIKKDTTEKDIWHTLRLAREAGIGNWLFLMVGNYEETAHHLAYTEDQLRRAVRDDLVQWRQVTVCTPVNGTELYRNAKKEGWLVEQPETGAQMHQVYASTPWLSQREIRYWTARLEGAGL